MGSCFGCSSPSRTSRRPWPGLWFSDPNESPRGLEFRSRHQRTQSRGLNPRSRIELRPDSNIKIAVSGPIVFQADPFARSSITTNTPPSGDFSGLVWWRFQKKDFAGKPIESTAMAGALVPGPQQETGLYRGLHNGPGYLIGAVTGVASRSRYVWVGSSYQRYAESRGDRRPDLLTYTAVYGYRPFSWRTVYPRWDWRVFAEFTGERTGLLRRQNFELPGSAAKQMFPSIAIRGSFTPKERYRCVPNCQPLQSNCSGVLSGVVSGGRLHRVPPGAAACSV